MGRIDIAIASAQIAGAATVWRQRWPRRGDAFTDGNNIQNKFNNAGAAGMSGSALGAGTLVAAIRNNSPCGDLTSSAVGNGFRLQYDCPMTWLIERPGGQVTADFQCWSIRATLSFDISAATGQDCGITVLPGNNGDMNVTSLAGVQLRVSDANQVKFQARRVNAGALTVDETVSASLTPDLADFNTFEVRAIGARSNRDAYVQGFINGIPVTQKYNWDNASALLPLFNASGGGFNFFNAGISNKTSGNVPHLYVLEMVLSAGRTESDLF